MNERYAADPLCCQTAFELKALFDRFGVYTGRALVNYPGNWEELLLKRFEGAPDVELSRIKTQLRRLKDRLGMTKLPSLNWRDNESWIGNAKVYLRDESPRFDGVLIPLESSVMPRNAYVYNDWDPPPTAEERIHSTPEEYARVGRSLLLSGVEVVIIDPYLNPCDRYVVPVLSKLIETAVLGKCRTFICFARSDEVLNEAKGVTPEVVGQKILELHEHACIDRKLELKYFLIHDSGRTRLHDRFILTVKGGVEVSQGFVQLKGGRKVTARPIGQVLHEELCSVFISGQHDMRVVREFVVR